MKEINLKKAVIVALKVLASLVVVWLFANVVSIPLGRAFNLSLTGWLILNSSVAAGWLLVCLAKHYSCFRRNYNVTLGSLQRCHFLNYSTSRKLWKIRVVLRGVDPEVQSAYLREIEEISRCRADANKVLGTFPAPLGRIQSTYSRLLAEQCCADMEDLEARTETLYQKAFG